jgi:hypothetical protein
MQDAVPTTIRLAASPGRRDPMIAWLHEALHAADQVEPRPLPERTTAPPKSARKIRVLRRRLLAGQALHHPDDADGICRQRLRKVLPPSDAWARVAALDARAASGGRVRVRARELADLVGRPTEALWHWRHQLPRPRFARNRRGWPTKVWGWSKVRPWVVAKLEAALGPPKERAVEAGA